MERGLLSPIEKKSIYYINFTKVDPKCHTGWILPSEYPLPYSSSYSPFEGQVLPFSYLFQFFIHILMSVDILDRKLSDHACNHFMSTSLHVINL